MVTTEATVDILTSVVTPSLFDPFQRILHPYSCVVNEWQWRIQKFWNGWEDNADCIRMPSNTEKAAYWNCEPIGGIPTALPRPPLNVWFASGYAQVCILLSVVIVTFPFSGTFEIEIFHCPSLRHAPHVPHQRHGAKCRPRTSLNILSGGWLVGWLAN